MPGVGLERGDGWYMVDGVAFTAGVITQQGPWSIDALSWWHWDPGGFVDNKFRRRLVWDPSIKESVHGKLTQEQSFTQWFVWDPSIGSQLRRATRLVHKLGLLEGKQSWGGRTVMSSFLFFFIVQPGGFPEQRMAKSVEQVYAIKGPDGVLRRFYGI